MNYLLQRLSQANNCTLGILFDKDHMECMQSWTLEDLHHDVKIPGQTRIPAGFYELKILKQETPLTLKHREAYKKATGRDWFKFHIEVCNVPGYSGVYIHSGIDDSHTEGCLLLAYIAKNNRIYTDDQLAESLHAVEDFYNKTYPYLDGGGKAFIEIRDEKFLIGK